MNYFIDQFYFHIMLICFERNKLEQERNAYKQTFKKEQVMNSLAIFLFLMY